MLPSFIHLRVRSSFSLSEGAIRIKELIARCQQENMPAVAITDSGNLFASLEFSSAAADAGVQPIIGGTFYFSSEYEPEARPHHRAAPEELVLLAKDDAGYHNLMYLASKPYLDGSAVGELPTLAYDDLVGRTDGLIALSGGTVGVLGRLLAQGREKDAAEVAKILGEQFPGRFYIELQRHGTETERRIERGLLDLAQQFNLPLVATNDAYFTTREMYQAHDALLCIADGRYISEQDRRRLTPEHYLKSPQEMQALFADLPEAVANTVKIAQRCVALSPKRAPILPRFAEDEDDMLREQARAGLEQRLNNLVFTAEMDAEKREEVAKPYRDRLEFELQTIINMKFPGYFLIVSDFIKWTKAHGIPVGPGRGSGAGSVVAWALLITDLDPLRYGLLFERFLNPERVSMPDFDIDFCQDRRDEVIRYVMQKYGHDRVAQIITFGKLQARAVLRDVGRVLQMPYGQVDKICKLVPNNPANPVTLQQAIDIEPQLKAAIREDETVEHLVNLALKLEGLNRHASTHAAGVVIGDRPLQELVPVYRDPKSDMAVVQYSMKYAEMAGLVKFDFLGLKTLTVLQKTVELLSNRGITIDLLKLPDGDKKTYAMLGAGDATGVFQMESAGMRDSLRRLKPDCIEDLIALGALYRPGPMDNIPTYIARKHGHEKPEYLHPALEKVLKETFGVIIYQEQVMQIAQLLAGYSLGEADLLRRAMGKKIRAEMEAQREIFVTRAIGNGVADDVAKAIFDLIAKFAEYGFNKSHAAAYAVITYQTAYLKANYPVEFYAASMTYDMHNTDKLATFKQEAARAGIQILPPDVNKSEVLFSVEYSSTRRGEAGRGAALGTALQSPPPNLPPTGGGTHRYPIQNAVDFARKLRKEMTDAEQYLWKILRSEQLGVKFRKQHPVGPYVTDFACLDPKLVIELDGGQHAEKSAVKKDAERTQYLEQQGFSVLRFWNNELFENIEAVLEVISSHLTPPPVGGRAGGGHCLTATLPSPPPGLPPTGGGELAIRYALSAIRNVGAQAMEEVVKERRDNGPFTDACDMTGRVGQAVNRRQMEYLVKAGAFDVLHPNRRQLFDALDMVTAYGESMVRERESNQISLFGEAGDGHAIAKPRMPAVPDWPPLEKLQYEQEAVGFYLSAHPLEGYQKSLKRLGVLTSSRFASHLGTAYSPVKVAGIVMGKKFRVSDKGKFAFLSLSDTGGIYEVAIFNETLLASARDLMENGNALLIHGDGKAEESGCRIIATGISKLDEAAQANQRGELHIAVGAEISLQALQSALGNVLPADQRNGLRVSLFAPVAAKLQGEFTLPGFYALPPGQIAMLRTVPGVLGVEEV